MRLRSPVYTAKYGHGTPKKRARTTYSHGPGPQTFLGTRAQHISVYTAKIEDAVPCRAQNTCRVNRAKVNNGRILRIVTISLTNLNMCCLSLDPQIVLVKNQHFCVNPL